MVFKSIPSYLKKLVIMSRTNIYKMMEVKGNLLFQGSSAALNSLFADNGVSFQEALLGKGSGNSSHGITESFLYDLDSQAWLLDNYPSVYNVNNNEILNSMKLKDSYSLDNLFDEDLEALSPASSSLTSSDVLETPAPSPLPATGFEFESIFETSNIGENDSADLQNSDDNSSLSNNNDFTSSGVYYSSSSGGYFTPGNCNMESEFKITLKDDSNLGSPDSGISSSDEMVFETDSSDILFDLFDGDCNENTSDLPAKQKEDNTSIVLPPMEKQPLHQLSRQQNMPEVSPKKIDVTIWNPTSNIVSTKAANKAKLETANSSAESNRYSPYKRKQKTEEQKLRKKAQNRSAALRYRHKKKDELNDIVKVREDLEEKNKELKGEVQSLSNEIDYLKKLMLDVINTRLAKTNSLEKENTNSLELLLDSP